MWKLYLVLSSTQLMLVENFSQYILILLLSKMTELNFKLTSYWNVTFLEFDKKLVQFYIIKSRLVYWFIVGYNTSSFYFVSRRIILNDKCCVHVNFSSLSSCAKLGNSMNSFQTYDKFDYKCDLLKLKGLLCQQHFFSSYESKGVSYKIRPLQAL